MRIYKEKNGKTIIDLEYNSLITNSIKIEIENYSIKNGIVYAGNSEDYNITKKDKEPQFKQGDKVLVSNDCVYWHESEFVTYYKDYYYAVRGRYKHIKPYEEEIKVGDWVFLNDEKGVCKITEKHDLKEVNNKFTLVKNPQLIILLNNEL